MPVRGAAFVLPPVSIVPGVAGFESVRGPLWPSPASGVPCVSDRRGSRIGFSRLGVLVVPDLLGELLESGRAVAFSEPRFVEPVEGLPEPEGWPAFWVGRAVV